MLAVMSTKLQLTTPKQQLLGRQLAAHNKPIDSNCIKKAVRK
jgi:hypothetical protein